MLQTFEGTAYGFGSEQHIAHVLAEQADILDLPISLNVRLGTAHQLKMGYYGAYMIRAINRVEEHPSGYVHGRLGDRRTNRQRS